MKKPNSHKRGLRIGSLVARLEYVNDHVRHFTLDLPIDKAAKQKAFAKLKAKG